VAFAAILLGFIFKISHTEWIGVCIALVLSLELINTSIEKTIDLLHPDFNERAGEIKDMAAAAVLVAAIISVIIGLIIFIPKILELI
jgi:diacylglycerol kinase (ATP)